MTEQKEKTEVLFSIPFNLNRSGGALTVNGKIVLYSDHVEVWEQETLAESILLKDVKEFSYDFGVGCSSIEAVFEDSTVILGRADMKHSNTLSVAAKRMNKIKSGIKPGDGFDRFKEFECPVCHMPLPRGSEVCPKCVKKTSYLKKLWDIAKPFKWLLLFSMLLYFVLAAISLLPPYLNKILVDNYIKADTAPVLIQFVLVVLAILAADLVTRLIGLLRAFVQIIAANKLAMKLRNMVFEKIQKLSIAGVAKKTVGELMQRITSDTRQLRVFLSDDLGNLIQNFVQIIAISIIIISYDWKLALLVLLPTPFALGLHRVIWSKMHIMYKKQWYLQGKGYTILHDIFSGIRVVKSFGREAAEMDRYDEVALAECRTRTRNELWCAYILPITNFFMGIGEYFLLYYVGTKIIGGEMTFGEMQQFSAYAFMIYAPLRWFAFLPRRLQQNMTSIVKIFELLDEKIDVEDAKQPKEVELSGNISINNVSFGYEASRDVLKNINLDIKQGEMIGIVGRSGVGKSTLINLIMRLYDAEEGSITFDGVDIKDISQECLRQQMGVVLQETLLFTGSLYANVAYGKPGATREEVLNAARLAGVHKFAIKLPDGYDTIIGEKGYTLSGGERQRVAIARAILHSPKILILDEATSALDTETEKDIQDAILELSHGRTTIAIAHRLSTLRNATRLVVLDRGTVAEVGTHEELMRQHGLYFELVMAQRQMSKMAPVKASENTTV